MKPRLPHQRSKEGNLKQQQRRARNTFIFRYSYRDPIQAETINRCTPVMIKEFLISVFDGVEMHLCNVERGEVLIDSRGRGTMQGGELNP